MVTAKKRARDTVSRGFAIFLAETPYPRIREALFQWNRPSARLSGSLQESTINCCELNDERCGGAEQKSLESRA